MTKSAKKNLMIAGGVAVGLGALYLIARSASTRGAAEQHAAMLDANARINGINPAQRPFYQHI